MDQDFQQTLNWSKTVLKETPPEKVQAPPRTIDLPKFIFYLLLVVMVIGYIIWYWWYYYDFSKELIKQTHLDAVI
ncbi:MAG: hypothetical protein ACYCQJ_13250 [Nitrososphaerales archaeon]